MYTVLGLTLFTAITWLPSFLLDMALHTWAHPSEHVERLLNVVVNVVFLLCVIRATIWWATKRNNRPGGAVRMDGGASQAQGGLKTTNGNEAQPLLAPSGNGFGGGSHHKAANGARGAQVAGARSPHRGGAGTDAGIGRAGGGVRSPARSPGRVVKHHRRSGHAGHSARHGKQRPQSGYGSRIV